MSGSCIGRGPSKWFPFLGLLSLLAGACSGPDPVVQPGSVPASPLDGAWRMVSAETITPDGNRIPWGAPESFLLFADGHYSLNWVSGRQPPEYFAERFKPTDAEKLARFAKLLVNAGSYRADGDVLTIHPAFAAVPEYVGGIGAFDYSLEGETLTLDWHTIRSVDGVSDPNTAIGVRFVTRWERRSLPNAGP